MYSHSNQLIELREFVAWINNWQDKPHVRNYAKILFRFLFQILLQELLIIFSEGFIFEPAIDGFFFSGLGLVDELVISLGIFIGI